MTSQALVKRSKSYYGELKDGKENGFGTMFHCNGAFYIGDWKEGKYHGKGLYKFVDGGSYDGEWFEGKQHGRGLGRYVNGDSYDGDFCEGKYHGRGLYKYVNGSSYEGEWCEGKRHGRGFCKFVDGGSYDGEWFEGIQNGRGLTRFGNGDCYNGEFCEDLPHGRGLLKFVDGDSYEGEWLEGKKHGRGLQKYANGDSYDGEWLNDKYHGKGLLKRPNGASYDGEWCEGQAHGRGLIKYADGSSYDGEWCEDKKDCFGVYKFTNGDSYIGEWRIGKRHGRGLYKSAKGDLYYGKWIDDVRECGNDLRIVIQDGSGLKRSLTVPTDSKFSEIFSAYEITTGRSPCRLKHNGRYIFYSQSKKKSLKHFNICNDDVVAVEVPVLADISNNYMTNNAATSPTKKRKVAKAKRQPSRQRRPWAGSVTDADSDRVKHSRKMNLVLKEIQPQLEQIRQHLNDLTLERTQPKNKTTTSKQAPANLEQIECRPNAVGMGSKAGKGSFVVNVGEANNLYKTSKHSKLIRSKPSICLDLHKFTKEQALAALNDSLPIWIETANSGMYPFVIKVRIVCGKGSQLLSEVVIQWINKQQQVAHAPKQKQ